MSAEEVSLRDLRFGTAEKPDRPTGSESARLAETSQIPENPAPEIRGLLHQPFRKTQPFYVTDETGALLCCSESFTQLSKKFLDNSGSLVELIESTRTASGEIKRSECFDDQGSQRHFSSAHFPIYSDQGTLLGFGGVYEETTRQVETAQNAAHIEIWFQDIFRSSSDWVWAIDHNYNLNFVSPRISENLGEPPHTLSGRHLFAMGGFTSEDPLASKT